MATYFGTCDSAGVFSGVDSNNDGDFVFWDTFTCPGSGAQTVTDWGTFGNGGGGTTSVRLAIYDAAGTTLIAQSSALSIVQNGGTPQTVEDLTFTASLTGGTSYILAWAVSSAGGFNFDTTKYLSSGVAKNKAGVGNTYVGSTFPASLPAPDSTTSGIYPIRVGVDPAAASIEQVSYRFFSAGDELPHYDVGATPLVEAADITTSGSNTAATTLAVAYPAYASGDLLISILATDANSAITIPSNGPNSETRVIVFNSTNPGAAGPTIAAMYWVGTGTQSASTQNWTVAASQEWIARTIKVPAGEFDASSPLAHATLAAGSNSDVAGLDSPAFTASRAGSLVVQAAAADDDPWSTQMPDYYAMRSTQDIGQLAILIATRDGATITAGTSGTATASSSIATVAGLSFGAVTPTAGDRLIAAHISWEANATITGVTIGGVTATQRRSAIDTVPNPDVGSEIWTAAVPTGTTGDVVITFNTGNPVTRATTFRLVNANATPSDTDGATGSAATIAISGLTIPENGMGLAGFANATDTTAVTWTGGTEVDDTDAGAWRHSNAIIVTAGTNTITADGATAAQALAGVAWQANAARATTQGESVGSVNFDLSGAGADSVIGGAFVIHAPRTADGRTPFAAANTPVTLDVDTAYGVQVRVYNSGGAHDEDTYKWQYRLNAGSWTDVTSSSSVVQTLATGDFADGDDVLEYLEGSGTWISNNNAAEETSGTFTLAAVLGATSAFEAHLNFKIIGTDVADEDDIELRIVEEDGTAFDTYTQTPTITVNDAGSITSTDASSAGTGAATGVGTSRVAVPGSSTGTATGTATGASNVSTAASSAGVATATASVSILISAAGFSAGSATADAPVIAYYFVAASSSGLTTAEAVGTSRVSTDATAASVATADAVGTSRATADANAAATSDAVANGASRASATASSDGTATAIAIIEDVNDPGDDGGGGDVSPLIWRRRREMRKAA